MCYTAAPGEGSLGPSSAAASDTNSDCSPRGYRGRTATTVTRQRRMVWRSNLACVLAHACRARLHVWDVSRTLPGSFQETSWKLPGRFPAHSKSRPGNAPMFSMCVATCAAHVCAKPRAILSFSSLAIAGPGMSCSHFYTPPWTHPHMEGVNAWGAVARGASRAVVVSPLRRGCSAAPRGVS